MIKVEPIGNKTHAISFLMEERRPTHYFKHNINYDNSHTFFTHLSYGRESNPDKKDLMVELSQMINYAESYPIEIFMHTHGHSIVRKQHKVIVYLPEHLCKRVEELIYQLRHVIGVIPTFRGFTDHVIFNSQEVQDWIVKE